MNANENLSGLPEEEGAWTPEEFEQYRQALEEAYPKPKISIRTEVMKRIEAEMAADRAKRRQQRMSRVIKWGSLAACLVLCTAVGIRVLPAMMRGAMKAEDFAAEEAYEADLTVRKAMESPMASVDDDGSIQYSAVMDDSVEETGAVSVFDSEENVEAPTPSEPLDQANGMTKQDADSIVRAETEIAVETVAVTEAATEALPMAASTEAAAETVGGDYRLTTSVDKASDVFCESAGWAPEAEVEAEAVTEESSDMTAVIRTLLTEGKAEYVMNGISYTCTVTEGGLSDLAPMDGVQEEDVLGYPAWMICEMDGAGTVQWYDEEAGRIFTVHAEDGTNRKALTKAAHWLIVNMNE